MDSFPTAHLASDCALGFRLRTWLPTAHLACLSRHLSQYLASDNGVRSLLPRPLSTQRVPVCCIPGCIVTCITLELRWCPGAGGVERRANSMRCENLMQPSWNGVGAEDLCRQLGSVGRTVMLFITGTTLALGVRGLSCARRRCCLFLLRRGTFPW